MVKQLAGHVFVIEIVDIEWWTLKGSLLVELANSRLITDGPMSHTNGAEVYYIQRKTENIL
jgi:hypothetical protein